MGSEHRHETTTANTKGTGWTTKLAEWADSSMQTETSTKESDLTTRHMGSGSTFTLTGPSTLGIGSVTNKTEEAWNLGLMVPSTKVNI